MCIGSLSYEAFKGHAPFTPSPATCMALPYFFLLSHKRHQFWENIMEHTRCVLIFSTFV